MQIAYAIGVAEPVSFSIHTYGTSTVSEEKLVKVIKKLWDLRPASIIDELDLLQPIYSRTAVYGHFGREEKGFTWEKINKVEALKSELT